MANVSHQMRLSSTLLRRLQQRVTAVNSTSSRNFTTTEGHRPTIVHKRSHDILHDPWFNKVLKQTVNYSLLCFMKFIESEFTRSIIAFQVFFFWFKISSSTICMHILVIWFVKWVPVLLNSFSGLVDLFVFEISWSVNCYYSFFD